MRFHHIGVACADLDREAALYESFGYRPERADFEDPLQGIRGRFLTGGGPRLELLVALEGSDILTPWLSRGTKMYHSAYEVPSLDETVNHLYVQRARTVSEPVPAVAFGGRQVTFLVLPNLALVELIEAPSGGGGQPPPADQPGTNRSSCS